MGICLRANTQVHILFLEPHRRAWTAPGQGSSEVTSAYSNSAGTSPILSAETGSSEVGRKARKAQSQAGEEQGVGGPRGKLWAPGLMLVPGRVQGSGPLALPCCPYAVSPICGISPGRGLGPLHHLG